MDITRKNYLELWLNDEPAVADGRASNRHTALVEAIEHAEEHALQRGVPGDYEIRVDGGLYYMVRIRDVVLGHTIEEEDPPAAQAEFDLDETSYSGNEGTVISFTIERSIRTDQVLDVDWAVVNASTSPLSGTQRFQAGESSKTIDVTADEVDTNEEGTVEILNPVLISGDAGAPILGTQSISTFFIFDTDQISFDPVDPQEKTYHDAGHTKSDEGWKPGSFIREGIDLSVNPSHILKHAGTFQGPTGYGIASYNDSHQIVRLKVNWEDVEPEENNWNVDFINDLLDNMDTKYYAAHLNMRGVVCKTTRIDTGVEVQTGQVTAPQWVIDRTNLSSSHPDYIKTFVETKGNIRRVNLDLTDSFVKARFLKIVTKLKATDFMNHPRLHNFMLHGVSNSQGEEWTGSQVNRTSPSTEDAWLPYIKAWTDAFVDAGVPGRLMWLKRDPDSFFNYTINNGCGTRLGGRIEHYLGNKYSPGHQADNGLIAEIYNEAAYAGYGDDDPRAEFYLTQDPDFPPVKNAAALQEQNEEYPDDITMNQTHHLMATMRCVQLRCDNVFIPPPSETVDQRAEHWLGYQLGQRPEDDSAEAFCWLGQWHCRGGGQMPTWGTYRMNNIEHWLYQRGYLGNGNYTWERDYDIDLGTTGLLSGYQNAKWAMKGSNIHFAVDPLYISGHQPIILRIFFRNQNTDPITVKWNKNDGNGIGGGQFTYTPTGDSDLQTIVAQIPSFHAFNTGTVEGDMSADIKVQTNGNTQFLGMNIVKDH